MSQLLQIALYDSNQARAARLADALFACNLRVTICSPGEFLSAPARADIDAMIIGWSRADAELALLVQELSRRCVVIVLLAEADLAAAHLLFVSGAAEICHPLLPTPYLATFIEKSVAAARTHRLRTHLWQPTA